MVLDVVRPHRTSKVKPTLLSTSESVCRVRMLDVDTMPECGKGMQFALARVMFVCLRAVYDCAQERIH